MSFPVFIPARYASRYSLLDQMAREVGEAFAAGGCPVLPWLGPTGEQPSAGRPGLFLFLNFPPSLEALPAEALRPGSRMALVQYFVDHPLALDRKMMDRLAELPNFRLVMPCVDGTHMLRMRWPRLRHAHCLHGVSRAALCEPRSIGQGREIDLIVAGSIHSEEELERLRGAMPAPLQRGCEDIVRLMMAHPWMPFEQAMEVVHGAGNASGGGGVMCGEWEVAAAVWRYATAALNRRRRVGLVKAMQGVRTVVVGAEAWAEHCTGTIEYRGDVAYADLPGVLSRARVCLAWGPTQFTHAASERILLSMAAGCATVADDRLLVRRHFGDHAAGGSCVKLFDAAAPDMARAAVDDLLSRPADAADMARRGRALIERSHLWSNRLELLAAVGSDAIAA